MNKAYLSLAVLLVGNIKAFAWTGSQLHIENSSSDVITVTATVCSQDPQAGCRSNHQTIQAYSWGEIIYPNISFPIRYSLSAVDVTNGHQCSWGQGAVGPYLVTVLEQQLFCANTEQGVYR